MTLHCSQNKFQLRINVMFLIPSCETVYGLALTLCDLIFLLPLLSTVLNSFYASCKIDDNAPICQSETSSGLYCHCVQEARLLLLLLLLWIEVLTVAAAPSPSGCCQIQPAQQCLASCHTPYLPPWDFPDVVQVATLWPLTGNLGGLS